MKIFLSFFLLFSFLFANERDDLIKKYHAPKPETKTIRQLNRWTKRKHKKVDLSIRKKILECLIANVADNLNRSTFAGN